jgi:cell division septal protein FtsQ
VSRPARANAGSESAANRRAIHIATLVMVWLLVGVGLGAGYYRIQSYVDRQLVFPVAPPRVVLLNQPAWMSDRLAQQIIESVRPAGTHSAFDQQMLIDIAGLLQSNPWVRHVNQVRRVYGNSPGDAVEVDCDYRTPAALARWGDNFWLVDGDGYELPEQYSAAQLNRIMLASDGTISLRVI